jgi:GNAT superfamily N-acetyltransferase
LLQHAGQDARRHVAAPFVLVDPATERVAGYYTLSAFAVAPTELQPDIVKKLPRYPLVPTTLLGRLAVATAFQGRGYGELLLLDALRRTLTHAPNVATIGVVVEARDDSAAAFYRRFDFRPFPDHARRLFLALPTIARLFDAPR